MSGRHRRDGAIRSPDLGVSIRVKAGTAGEVRKMGLACVLLGWVLLCSDTAWADKWRLPVHRVDPWEVMTLLRTLVPDVGYAVDPDRCGLICEGSSAALEQVEELIAELDAPVTQVAVDVKLTELASEQSFKKLCTCSHAGQIVSLPGGSVTTTRAPFVIASNLQMLVSSREATLCGSWRQLVGCGDEAVFHMPVGRLRVRPIERLDGHVSIDLALEGEATVDRLHLVTIDGDTIVVGYQAPSVRALLVTTHALRD